VGVLLVVDGHDVVTARDLSGERLPDDAQLLLAVRSKRTFVTHNRADFKMLHDAWVTWPAACGMSLPRHPGILVMDTASPERLANGIFWWHHRDGWRRPGIGASWEPHQPATEREQE